MLAGLTTKVGREMSDEEEQSKWGKFWTGSDYERETEASAETDLTEDEILQARLTLAADGVLPAEEGVVDQHTVEPDGPALAEVVRVEIVPSSVPMDQTETTTAVVLVIFFPFLAAFMGAGLIARGSYEGTYVLAGTAISIFAWAFIAGLISGIVG